MSNLALFGIAVRNCVLLHSALSQRSRTCQHLRSLSLRPLYLATLPNRRG
ncbi:MAG: hypothetical protein LH647_09495 [Leptolyngbyaceae cyanobacterium CAN_BIN12]|nr:hypothetical protein [Leptolyngbyaceae cyanobacterium CAN_BIN12]